MYNECYMQLEEVIMQKNLSIKDLTLVKKEGSRIMLTPTKNLHEDKSIIKIGARILSILNSPHTVSSAWKSYVQIQEHETNGKIRIQFDNFILAIDFLYIIGAIEYGDDLMWRSKNDKKDI